MWKGDLLEPENIRKELFFNSREYKEEIRGMERLLNYRGYDFPKSWEI